jgi:cytochrome c oxidase cbb3-type subunit 2
VFWQDSILISEELEESMPSHKSLSTVLALVWAAVVTARATQQAQVGDLTGDARRGQELYQRYCIGCHGPRGDGQGENAPYLEPGPRDFTAGVFKCRSTDTGHIPSDADLYETIGRGVHASAMPSWLPLTRQQRIDLLAYVKSFSPRFREEKPEPVVPIPPEPPATQESIQRGHDVYKKMECAKCHGEQGRGDGPSVPTLTDSKDRPIVPYDFTTGERFKCGQSNQDLYRIFMTGLDGTPMPSYLQDLKPDQAWDLVHYLRTLQVNFETKTKGGERKAQSSRHVLRSLWKVFPAQRNSR